MQAGHPVAVAEHVERRLAHAGHDPHRGRHVGGVGELHADVGDRRTERAHRERHDVHRAALHGSRVEARASRRASRPGSRQLLFGPACVGGRRADERAVLDAGDVGRIGVGPVAVRALGLVELGERAGVDELSAQAVVLLGGTVAPVARGRAAGSLPTRRPNRSSRWLLVVAAHLGSSLSRDGSSRVVGAVVDCRAARLKSAAHVRPRASGLKRSNAQSFRRCPDRKTRWPGRPAQSKPGVPMSISEPRRRAVARPAVVEIEDHALALPQHAEDRALERVVGEVVVGDVGVAHDDTVSRCLGSYALITPCMSADASRTGAQPALTTLPDLMQLVQTLTRLVEPFNEGADALDVRVPATLGTTMGVRHRHAPRGALATHFTNRCHEFSCEARSKRPRQCYQGLAQTPTDLSAYSCVIRRDDPRPARILTPCPPWNGRTPSALRDAVTTFRDTVRAARRRAQPAERLSGARRRHRHEHGPHARRGRRRDGDRRSETTSTRRATRSATAR